MKMIINKHLLIIKLEMIVDNLVNKLSNSGPNSVSYEKWAQLISAIAYKVVKKNIYEDG